MNSRSFIRSLLYATMNGSSSTSSFLPSFSFSLSAQNLSFSQVFPTIDFWYLTPGLPSQTFFRTYAPWFVLFSYLYQQGGAKRSHAGIVLTQWSKNGFSSLRVDVLPINAKFGMNRLQVRYPVLNSTFIAAEMCEYSPQNCQNFEFWP